MVWDGYMEYMDWSYGTPLGIGILAYTHVFVVCVVGSTLYTTLTDGGHSAHRTPFVKWSRPKVLSPAHH